MLIEGVKLDIVGRGIGVHLTPVLMMEGLDGKGDYFFRSFHFPYASLEVSFPVDGSQTGRKKVYDVKR